MSAASFPVVCTGPAADVRLSPDVHEQYKQAIDGNDEISTKRKTHLERSFREFCDHAQFKTRLSDQKFKREDNLSDGCGGKVTIWTFKGWQWRVYGAIMAVAGKRSFVGVNVDPSKKRDRADQGMLKATAKAIGRLAEYGGK